MGQSIVHTFILGQDVGLFFELSSGQPLDLATQCQDPNQGTSRRFYIRPNSSPTVCKTMACEFSDGFGPSIILHTVGAKVIARPRSWGLPIYVLSGSTHRIGRFLS